MKSKWNQGFIRIWYQINYIEVYLVMKLIDLFIFIKSIRDKYHKDLINQVVIKLEYITLSILTSAKLISS